MRRILRIKYTDRVSNAKVRVRTGQEIAENIVRKRRMVWTYLQNEQREVAIHSSKLEAANRKTTCWTLKATVDGQYREGFEKSWFVIVWQYHRAKPS